MAQRSPFPKTRAELVAANYKPPDGGMIRDPDPTICSTRHCLNVLCSCIDFRKE